jgi:hypothetical protein
MVAFLVLSGAVLGCCRRDIAISTAIQRLSEERTAVSSELLETFFFDLAQYLWGETMLARMRTDVAKVIEFYIPSTFQRRVKSTPPQQRGTVIEFPLAVKKPA